MKNRFLLSVIRKQSIQGVFVIISAKKGEYPFEAAAFTSIERLEKFCEEEPA